MECDDQEGGHGGERERDTSGGRRSSLSLDMERDNKQQQHQVAAASSWRAAAASFRESLSRSLSVNQLEQQEKDDEVELKWAALERLPTLDRLHTSLFAGDGVQVVDVRRLGAAERRMAVDALIADIHRDNLRLLRKQRQRMDRVGVRPPTVEVRWRDLCVEAECQVVQGKPLPTIWNAAISNISAAFSMLGFNRQHARISILHGVSGVVKPSRLTLLLGPPGCGKTTLLKALAGKLNGAASSLKVTGEIEYNGVSLKDFVPEKTAVYIDQYDLHVPEMTVRETIDFSARFQGVGSRAEIMKEVIKREKEAGITPDPDVDTYMKVLSRKDQQQYWSCREEPYNFVTVDQFHDKFIVSQVGQNLAGEISMPYDKSKGHKNALAYSIYSLSKWELLKACFARELLLMKRNAFIYITKTVQEMKDQGYMERKLQLLHNITGAFQPGVLSALMGVTGAGKTTLLDVLAGRKTGGVIEGDIKVGGYPKVQQTFARISGYCEQTDVHSPQITVGESVAYSAWLRLPTEIDSKTRNEFVNQVLETIELDEIKDALVGIPGINGLSTEQRKRLTIAVELVSNPSIIFMDEPTSGLDARAAAIVMRAVKNVADTGRTVVCTIHQPSIEIFEAFDEAIPGVPKIDDNYNPSTWMLEVTSTSMEAHLRINFAQIYRDSSMYKNDQQGLFTILGCMYGTTLFVGINNCQSVMPFVSIERSVVYRERFAGMYSSWAYSFAQVNIDLVSMEIPYVFVQIVLFMFIAYPMIGYTWEAAKFFWFFYTMFCTVLYFLYLGMMMVSLTPNIQVASILASMFYTIQNLMSGFIVPSPQVPKWWLWLYYTSPMSWTLNVFFTTQFGYEDDKKIEVFGETKSIAAFVRDYFGFRRELLPLTAIVMAAFPILFATLFGYNISKLNFQRR
nr:unnamed protein product [Digitaria exilis]